MATGSIPFPTCFPIRSPAHFSTISRSSPGSSPRPSPRPSPRERIVRSRDRDEAQPPDPDGAFAHVRIGSVRSRPGSGRVYNNRQGKRQHIVRLRGSQRTRCSELDRSRRWRAPRRSPRSGTPRHTNHRECTDRRSTWPTGPPTRRIPTNALDGHSRPSDCEFSALASDESRRTSSSPSDGTPSAFPSPSVQVRRG